MTEDVLCVDATSFRTISTSVTVAGKNLSSLKPCQSRGQIPVDLKDDEASLLKNARGYHFPSSSAIL